MQEPLFEFVDTEEAKQPWTLTGAAYVWLTGIFSRRRLPYWGLAVVCAASNVALPSLFWRHPERLLTTAICGGLTMQLALVATYAALYVKVTWESKCWAALMVLAVWSSYMIGLNVAEGRNGVPFEPAIFLLAVAVVGALWHYLILVTLKRVTGICIAHRTDDLEKDVQSRLSIGSLMTATTVVAIGFCMVRWLWPESALGSWPRFMPLVIGAITLSVIGSSLSIMSMLLCLAPRLSAARFVALALTIPVWFGVFRFILQLFAFSEKNYGSVSFLAGHMLFSVLVFFLVRLTGYRWRKIPAA